MNKMKIVLIVIILSALASIGVHFFKQDKKEQLTIDSSDNQKYDMVINVQKDSFEGYRIICSTYMKNQLRSAKYLLNCIDDGADYDKRLEALKSGSSQFALMEVGAYVAAGKDYDYPATIIAVIDSSFGADGILANKDKFTSIEELKNIKNTKIALTPNSPSEVFAKIAASHFDLNFLNDKSNIVNSNDSFDAFKKLNKGEVDLAVLWEPHLSQALSTGNYIKILSTKESQDTIIDVLTVNRKFSQENPNVVNLFLASYFKSLKYYNDNPQQLIQEIKSDTSLKEDDIKIMVDGIKWINLNENCKKWFACDKQDWTAQLKIIDTLDNNSKIWIESGLFNSNPFPRKDTYTMVNSDFLLNLLVNGVGLYDVDNNIVNSLERDFKPLNNTEWLRLKEFGTLKQRAILFVKENELRLTSKEAIDDLAKDLEHYPNYRFRIEGHTGTLGDAIKNKIISESRAEWVKRYLVMTYSIDPDRIQVIGYGGEKPLKPDINETNFSKSYQSKLSRVSLVLLQEEY